MDIRRLRFGGRTRFLRFFGAYSGYFGQHPHRQVLGRPQPAISGSAKEWRSGHFVYDNQ